MTPITGITEEDLQIATAIEKAIKKCFNEKKWDKIIKLVDDTRLSDTVRALGRYAAEDPEFRAATYRLRRMRG